LSRAANDFAADIRDLTHAEHAIVWAFRVTAMGRSACPMVDRVFRDLAGPVAAEAKASFTVFVEELRRQGRRTVTLAPPGMLTMTRDEQLIVAVFAAAQVGDYQRLDAHLTWLLGRSPQAPFAAAACLVADAFSMTGAELRQPDMVPPAAPELPARAPNRRLAAAY
jgi:hypothetical protein